MKDWIASLPSPPTTRPRGVSPEVLARWWRRFATPIAPTHKSSRLEMAAAPPMPITFAVDLGKGASDVLPAGSACCPLTDNVAWMTAIGNDYSYEDIFVRQLMNMRGPETCCSASA